MENGNGTKKRFPPSFRAVRGIFEAQRDVPGPNAIALGTFWQVIANPLRQAIVSDGLLSGLRGRSNG